MATHLNSDGYVVDTTASTANPTISTLESQLERGIHPLPNISYDPRNEHEFPVKQLIRTWTIRYQTNPTQAPSFHHLHFLVLLTLEGFQISQIVSPRQAIRHLLPLAASPRCAPFDLVFIPCPLGTNISIQNESERKQHDAATQVHPLIAVTSILDAPADPSSGDAEHYRIGSTQGDTRFIQLYSLAQRRWVDRIALPSSVFGIVVWGDVLIAALETELHFFRIAYADPLCEIRPDPGIPSFELFATLPCYPNVRGRPIPLDISDWGLVMCPPTPFRRDRSISRIMAKKDRSLASTGHVATKSISKDSTEENSTSPVIKASEESEDHSASKRMSTFQEESLSTEAPSTQTLFSTQVRDTLAHLAASSRTAAAGATGVFRSAISNPAKETVSTYVSALAHGIAKAKTGAVDMVDRALTRILVMAETERTRLLAQARIDVAIAAESKGPEAPETHNLTAISVDNDVDVIPPLQTNQNRRTFPEDSHSKSTHPPDSEHVPAQEGLASIDNASAGWFSSITTSVSKMLTRTGDEKTPLDPTEIKTTPTASAHATIVPSRESSSYLSSVLSSTVSAVASGAKTAALAVSSSLTTVADQAREPSLLSVPSVGDVVGQAAHVAWALNHHNHPETSSSIPTSGGTAVRTRTQQESLTLLLTSPEERRIACARSQGAREGLVAVFSLYSTWNTCIYVSKDRPETQLGSCLWQMHVPFAVSQVTEASSNRKCTVYEDDHDHWTLINTTFGEANLTGSHYFIEWLQWRPGPVPGFACVTERGAQIIVFTPSHVHLSGVYGIHPLPRRHSASSFQDLAIHALLKRGRTPGQIRSLSWARDGEWLLVTSATGTVHVFHVPLSESVHADRLACLDRTQLKRTLARTLGIPISQPRLDVNSIASPSPSSSDAGRSFSSTSDNSSVDTRSASLSSPSELSPLVGYTDYVAASLPSGNFSLNSTPTGGSIPSSELTFRTMRTSKFRLRFAELLKDAKIRIMKTNGVPDTNPTGALPFALPITAAFVPKSIEFGANDHDIQQDSSIPHILSMIRSVPPAPALPRDDILVLGASPRLMLVYSIEPSQNNVVLTNMECPSRPLNHALGSLRERTLSPDGFISTHGVPQTLHTTMTLSLCSRWYIPPFGTKFFASVQASVTKEPYPQNSSTGLKPTLQLQQACDPQSHSEFKFHSFLQFIENNALRVPSSPLQTEDDHQAWSSCPALPLHRPSKLSLNELSQLFLWHPELISSVSQTDGTHAQNPAIKNHHTFVYLDSSSKLKSNDNHKQSPFLTPDAQLAVLRAAAAAQERSSKLIAPTQEEIRSRALSTNASEERFSLTSGVKSPPNERDRHRLLPEFGTSKPTGLPTPPLLPQPNSYSPQLSPLPERESAGQRASDGPAQRLSPPPPPPPSSTSGRRVLNSSDPLIRHDE